MMERDRAEGCVRPFSENGHSGGEAVKEKVRLHH